MTLDISLISFRKFINLKIMIMIKNVTKLGKPLTREQQKTISGGYIFQCNTDADCRNFWLPAPPGTFVCRRLNGVYKSCQSA